MERTAGQRDSELVRQTAELLSAGGPLSHLFEQLCLLLAQYVDASVVFIALDSESGIHIEFVYDHGNSVRDAHVPVQPESQSFRIMHTGESLLMRGPDDLPGTLVPLQIPRASKEDTASAIFVPLRFGSRPIGVLSVQSPEPGAYDERDLQLLETCALYVAAGIQGALAGREPFAGVAMRRVFEDRLETEWHRARRAGGSVGLILMDVDVFKRFNATYGHVAGDACLAQVAQAARGCLSRSTDLFARYGGEEFAVVLPDTRAAAAMALAERMRKAVSALQIPHVQSAQGIVTASFGVACASAADGDAHALVRCADRALYAAKRSGRNRAVLETLRQIDEEAPFEGNLPQPAAVNVGRMLERDALARSLALSRLTTVVGPPGVGKTHCALDVAHQLTNAYVHGAWFYDLSSAADAAELVRALKAEVNEFAPKHCLMVIDHCDASESHVADLCRAILAQAPRVTMLLTGSQPLAIEQERVFHLSPFTRGDATAFFCSRASTAASASIFGERDRAMIRDLCAQLGDLPLAIELVSPIAADSSIERIGAALADRRADLWGLVEFAYDSLSECAQRLLERLTIFRGTFDAEAAREVCGFLPLRPGEAAAALDDLAERHLIQVLHEQNAKRFRLPRAVAEFASSRLHQRGEAQVTAQRHAGYYLTPT